MGSPFLGMNPYGERASVWHDFHESFLPQLREVLTAQVVPRYFVRIDEHPYIHPMPSGERQFMRRGDVRIPALAERSTAAVATRPTIEAPAEVGLPEFGLPEFDTERCRAGGAGPWIGSKWIGERQYCAAWRS